MYTKALEEAKAAKSSVRALQSLLYTAETTRTMELEALHNQLNNAINEDKQLKAAINLWKHRHLSMYRNYPIKFYIWNQLLTFPHCLIRKITLHCPTEFLRLQGSAEPPPPSIFP